MAWQVAIQRFRTIEQKQIHSRWQVASQGDQRIPFANFNQITHPALNKITPRQLNLRRFKLAADQHTATVVPQRCRQVQSGEAKRGTEFDDGFGLGAARQHVQQFAGVAGDGQPEVFEHGVEFAVFGFAVHQAFAFFAGYVVQRRAGGGAGLGVEAFDEGRQRFGGQGCHDGFP